MALSVADDPVRAGESAEVYLGDSGHEDNEERMIKYFVTP